MYKIELTVISVPNNDANIIYRLHKLTEQPVDKIKECISNGLPIFTKDFSYEEFYFDYTFYKETYYFRKPEIGALIEFCKEKNVDVVIEHDNNKFTLEEFIKFRKKKTIYKYLQIMRIYTINGIHEIKYKCIRIGKFNELPLYFQFITPDGSDYYNGWEHSIVTSFGFLLQPKYAKKFTLWHEYGHHCINTYYASNEEFYTTYKIIEAMANFYACCKCKLNFNLFCEIYVKYCKSKIKTNNESYSTYFEQRYEKIEENDMEIEDYVYEFYRDNSKLLQRYKKLFKEHGSGKKFNWTNFLNEN